MCFNNFFIANLCHKIYLFIFIFFIHIRYSSISYAGRFGLCEWEREIFNDFWWRRRLNFLPECDHHKLSTCGFRSSKLCILCVCVCVYHNITQSVMLRWQEDNNNELRQLSHNDQCWRLQCNYCDSMIYFNFNKFYQIDLKC
jgi:hypothetical protein